MSLELAGRRVVLVGKMGGMPKRQAQQLLRQHGAIVLERLDPTASLAIVGEAELPGIDRDDLASLAADAGDDEAIRGALDRGELELLRETQLWQALGLVEGDAEQGQVQRLYTAAMLAELLSIPVAVIRRWHRRGLIVPAREVRKLAYFDFQEVTTARRLAELMAAGVSPQALERKLAWLERHFPEVARPLAQLSVLVEGKQVLLRQGDGLIGPGGQRQFDFDAAASESIPPVATPAPPQPSEQVSPPIDLTPDEAVRAAEECEDAGDLRGAMAWYRAALATGGPQADVCFRLAELLYQSGQPAAACERYYMAIELDEDFVEARANLGCVLAESGETELAISALTGALAYHSDYADAHFHLARVLADQGQHDLAAPHWQAFLRLDADSPWAEEARQRLAEGETRSPEP